MVKNPRFQVRDSEDELKRLEDAIKILGFKDKAAWYNEMKWRAILEAEKKISKE